MTLILGMHLVEYVLLAADRRVCFYPNGQLEHHDTYEKISVFPWGLSSATGVNHLIDRVEELLHQQHPQSSEDLLRAVNQGLDDIRCSRAFELPGVAEGVEATSWYFVLRLAGDTPSESGLRLVRIGSNTDWTLEAHAPGDGSMNRPKGASAELMREQRDRASERVAPMAPADNLEAHLASHIELCCDIFKSVSDGCETVSATFHVGLMFPDGRRFLSELIDSSGARICRFVEC